MLSVAGRFVAHDFTPSAALASGPILEARSAGSHAASSATANSITGAQADTAASHGSTPNSRPAIRRLCPKAAGIPTAMPARARFAPCQTNPSYGCGAKVALRLAVSGKLSAVVGAAPPKLARGGITVTLSPAQRIPHQDPPRGRLGHLHAAADAVAVPADRGMRAVTVVPWFGFESIESCPPTNLRRSLMLVRPSPCPLLATLASNPTPESCTLSSICCGEPVRETSNTAAPLYFTAL
jgi:hypothetical protein